MTGPGSSQNSGLEQASGGGVLRGSGTVSLLGPVSFAAHVPQGTHHECISPVPSPASPPSLPRSRVTGRQRGHSCVTLAITLKGLPWNDSSICCQSISGPPRPVMAALPQATVLL